MPDAGKVRVTCPLVREDMAVEHQLYWKPRGEYWHTYAGPVIRALQTLDNVELVAPDKPLERFTLTWEFPGCPPIKTAVDYRDEATVEWWRGVDVQAVFKMKYHPSRIDAPLDIPIYPGGFCLAVDAGKGDTDDFLAKELENLRALKAGPQVDEVFYNRFTFRWFSSVRLENRIAWGKFFNPRRGRLPQDQFFDKLARCKFTLNCCGNRWSIDRKVVEALAIGCVIISDRGLEDLELPWGHRFEHGENILFVDKPEDVAPLAASVSERQWRTISQAAIRLYRGAFAPGTMGDWYLKCAKEVACSGSSTR